jgi:hypothetical protein
MLADDQHAIDAKLWSTQRQRFRDTRINLHSVPAFPVAAQVTLGKLVHVKRHQIHGRPMMPALPPVPFEKAIDEMLRMSVPAHFRGEEGDFLSSRARGGVLPSADGKSRRDGSETSSGSGGLCCGPDKLPARPAQG